jgi:hypothetical protein
MVSHIQRMPYIVLTYSEIISMMGDLEMNFHAVSRDANAQMWLLYTFMGRTSACVKI